MQAHLKKNIDIISLLRFPLIVGVVFIHSLQLSVSEFSGYNFCYNLITEKLCGVCVPLFFFFSGYLFFQNIDRLDFCIYKTKIRRRINTLLIPFIFWNLFVVAIIGTGQLFCPSLFSGAFKNVSDFNVKDWLSVFYCSLGTNKPIAYQLWFLRDLIVMSALAPIIYYICRYLKLWWLAALMVLYLLGVKSIVTGLNFFSLFFYCTGCLFGIEKRVFVFDDLKLRYVSILCYFILLILELLLNEYSCAFFFVHRANVIVGCIAVLQLASIILEKHDITQVFVNKPSIINSSFFIYCYHGIFATFLGKFASSMTNSDVYAVFFYFAIVVLLVVFGVVAYNALLRTLPRFTGIITGGRN